MRRTSEKGVRRQPAELSTGNDSRGVDRYDAPEVVIRDLRRFAEGMRIDRRNTLRENLADLIGLRVALDAFKDSAVQEERADQRVYPAAEVFARVWVDGP